MRTLVNKFDSKIRFAIPKQLVSEIVEDGWVIKIPNGRGTFLQSFFPGNMWDMIDGYMEDDIIIDFLRTLKEVVDLRKDFKNFQTNEITRGKDGCK